MRRQTRVSSSRESMHNGSSRSGPAEFNASVAARAEPSPPKVPRRQVIIEHLSLFEHSVETLIHAWARPHDQGHHNICLASPGDTRQNPIMEFRRAGEALLRTQSSILPFLAPAITRQSLRARTAYMAGNARHLSTPTKSTSTRCFSTSLRRFAANDDTNSATPKDPWDSLLNATLDRTKGVSTTSQQRTSKFKSSSAQDAHRVSPAPDTSGTNSFEDLLSRFGPAHRTPGSRNPSSPASSRSDFTRGLDIGRMMDPLGNTAGTSVRGPAALPQPLEVRLGPSLGRSVAINPNRGIDVGRAFRSLEIACARNKVRQDFGRQRFHERPGLKRKRLKSERWRVRFKEGFRGMVKMVNQMRKKGW